MSTNQISPDQNSPDQRSPDQAPLDQPAGRGLGIGAFLGLVLAPFVLAAAIILVASAVNNGGSADPASGTTYEFSIPAGTAERMERGEPVDDVFPERMAARVGDTYVLTNYDGVTHQLGPLVVRAGETASVTFYEAGTYLGACTVGDHDEITIVVT